ncbi:NAD-dependent epimerase/dehydratase family protein, partial [Escherichia coli]|nr:NAD-dependent epimerase/dehydratase family protein [Escherichia coli]
DLKAVAYGLPKIIGTKMCESYNLQYGTNFITLYLANLYGETTEFDLQKAKVLPALLRKFHLAKDQKMAVVDEVLKDLPEWFGIPESTQAYTEGAKDLQVWAAYQESDLLGFVS